MDDFVVLSKEEAQAFKNWLEMEEFNLELLNTARAKMGMDHVSY